MYVEYSASVDVWLRVHPYNIIFRKGGGSGCKLLPRVCVTVTQVASHSTYK